VGVRDALHQRRDQLVTDQVVVDLQQHAHDRHDEDVLGTPAAVSSQRPAVRNGPASVPQQRAEHGEADDDDRDVDDDVDGERELEGRLSRGRGGKGMTCREHESSSGKGVVEGTLGRGR